jgi:hypothetical protein
MVVRAGRVQVRATVGANGAMHCTGGTRECAKALEGLPDWGYARNNAAGGTATSAVTRARLEGVVESLAGVALAQLSGNPTDTGKAHHGGSGSSSPVVQPYR